MSESPRGDGVVGAGAEAPATGAPETPPLPLPTLAPSQGPRGAARVRFELTRIKAVLLGRCPRCFRGRVFGGVVAMNPACPECGLRFGREAGYFVGAMYFSYGLAVVGMGLFLWAAALLWPRWSWTALVAASTIAFLPFVPWTFRTSRVIWLFFDHFFDPQ